MKYLKQTGIFLGALLASQTSYSAVSSISAEEFAQYGREDAYWVFTANCTDDDKGRVVQRKTDGSDWCGKDVEGFCDSDKNVAAEKVCSSEYTQALGAIADKKKREEQSRSEQRQAEERRAQQAREQKQQAEAAKAAAEQKTRENQISIEEQLLQIEQQKLELRRQELELQRRSVEVQEALDKAS